MYAAARRVKRGGEARDRVEVLLVFWRWYVYSMRACIRLHLSEKGREPDGVARLQKQTTRRGLSMLTARLAFENLKT